MHVDLQSNPVLKTKSSIKPRLLIGISITDHDSTKNTGKCTDTFKFLEMGKILVGDM